jgi:hypothetical protein
MRVEHETDLPLLLLPPPLPAQQDKDPFSSLLARNCWLSFRNMDEVAVTVVSIVAIILPLATAKWFETVLISIKR